MRKLAIIVIITCFTLLSSCILYFFRDSSLGGWENVGEQFFTEEDIGGIDLLYDSTEGPLLFLSLDNFSSDRPAVRVYNYSADAWAIYTEDLEVESSPYDIFAGFLEDNSICVIPLSAEGSVFNLQSDLWVNIGDPVFNTQSNITAGFSKDGILYLVVEDISNSNVLSVFSYAGSSWQILGAGGEFDAAEYVWTGFDQSANLLLFLCQTDTAGDDLTVYRWTDPNWIQLGSFPNWAGTPVLCNDPISASDSKLWCLVSDERQGYPDTALLEYTGTEWLDSGAGSLSAAKAYSQGTLVNKEGSPLVSLVEDTAFTEITIKQKRDDIWEALGVPGFTFGDAVNYNSKMTIGTDGYLYLAYIALGHDSRASVMRYLLE